MKKYRSYSDLELFHLSQQKDEWAFSELYERYRLQVYDHAYLFVQDYDKAQDVAQEVFFKLWEKIDTIAIVSSFKGYLHTAVRHYILNQLAKEKVVNKYTHEVANRPLERCNSTEDYLLEKELLHILEEKIDRLPRKMKTVFRMSREDHLSHAEISDRLHISTKTVRQQIYNALLILKSSIKYIFLLFFL